MDLNDLIFAIEMIGTIAFAFSGTMVAVEQVVAGLFGVIVLSIVTAVGLEGVPHLDLILGIYPPLMFQNSVYAKVSTLVAIITFFIIYFNTSFVESRYGFLYIYYELI